MALKNAKIGCLVVYLIRIRTFITVFMGFNPYKDLLRDSQLDFFFVRIVRIRMLPMLLRETAGTARRQGPLRGDRMAAHGGAPTLYAYPLEGKSGGPQTTGKRHAGGPARLAPS